MARAALTIGIKIAARPVWLLPTPLEMSWSDGVSRQKWPIPLADGGKSGGASKGIVRIQLRGKINRAGDGTQLPDWAAQEAQLRLLRERLWGDQTSNWDFRLYYSNTAGALRYFKEVELAGFDPDLSNIALITWTATLEAKDPVIYVA